MREMLKRLQSQRRVLAPMGWVLVGCALLAILFAHDRQLPWNLLFLSLFFFVLDKLNPRATAREQMLLQHLRLALNHMESGGRCIREVVAHHEASLNETVRSSLGYLADDHLSMVAKRIRPKITEQFPDAAFEK